MVYRLKDEDGGKKRYQARLVVKGLAHKKGIDFDEIFSLVFKLTSIRTVLSLVAVKAGRFMVCSSWAGSPLHKKSCRYLFFM